MAEASGASAAYRVDTTDNAASDSEEEDFSDIDAFNVLSVAGTDRDGSPVFSFASANLPSDPQIDWDKLHRSVIDYRGPHFFKMVPTLVI